MFALSVLGLSPCVEYLSFQIKEKMNDIKLHFISVCFCAANLPAFYNFTSLPSSVYLSKCTDEFESAESDLQLKSTAI